LSPDQLVALLGSLSTEEKQDGLNALLMGATFVAGVGVGSAGLLGAIPCHSGLKVLTILDILLEMEPLLRALALIENACGVISCIASLIGRILPAPYQYAYNATVPLACINALMAKTIADGGMDDVRQIREVIRIAYEAKCGDYSFPYDGVIRGIIESKLTVCGGDLWL